MRTTGRFAVRTVLLSAAATLPMGVVLAGGAVANPQGGSVVGGSATINHVPGTTTIDQHSDRAVIDWQSFSIDESELTRFNQPGESAIALNRVVGNDPSLILGRLEANGQVWLINPSGVLFGASAQVDVNGLVATTADIRNESFLGGDFDFSIASPDPDASVVNAGTISFGDNGMAALVAPHVRNDGLIVGRLGQVILAGAPTFTLDFQGDGLIQFAATSDVLAALNGGEPLVDNQGTIRADGGHVLITAAASADIVDSVINVDGVVEAQSIYAHNGTIVLDGGDSGIVQVAGLVDATGADSGTPGGTIEVVGDTVALLDDAVIDVSGMTGGGTIRIGQRDTGVGDPRKARLTTVAADAVIAADALDAGDGGHVTAWADQHLDFRGQAKVRGGPNGGDGGYVDTSSPGRLFMTGVVDASASAGENGRWRLDPLDVRIVADGGTHAPPISRDDPPQAGEALVAVASITGSAGTVTIEAERDIDVDAGFVTDNALVFDAGEKVTIAQKVETGASMEIRARDVKTTGAGRVVAAELVVLSNAAVDPSAPRRGAGDVVIRGGFDKAAVGVDEPTDIRFHKVRLVSDRDIAVDAIGDTKGVTAQRFTIKAFDETVTINEPVTTTRGNNSITIVAERFVNNVGPAAFDSGRGHYFVYTSNPADNQPNGLDGRRVFGKTFRSAPPGAIGQGANFFVFEVVTPLDPGDDDIATALKDVTIDDDVTGAISSEGSELAAYSDSNLFSVTPVQGQEQDSDVLFSNDGNHALWGLGRSGTRPPGH